MLAYGDPVAWRHDHVAADERALRVLVLAPDLDTTLLNGGGLCIDVPEYAESFAAALDRAAPAVALLDAAHLDGHVAAAFARPAHRSRTAIILADLDHADRAALLLDLPDVRFVPRAAPLATVREALRDARAAAGVREGSALAPLPAASGDGPSPDPARVRAIIRARRARHDHFPGDWFADPAWDMLLDLSSAELHGARVSVSSLCAASGVPATTALRWIKRLADEGHLVRRDDPADRRRMFIEMAPGTSRGMRACLAAMTTHLRL